MEFLTARPFPFERSAVHSSNRSQPQEWQAERANWDMESRIPVLQSFQSSSSLLRSSTHCDTLSNHWATSAPARLSHEKLQLLLPLLRLPPTPSIALLQLATTCCTTCSDHHHHHDYYHYHHYYHHYHHYHFCYCDSYYEWYNDCYHYHHYYPMSLYVHITYISSSVPYHLLILSCVSHSLEQSFLLKPSLPMSYSSGHV